jgi:hypothetical protein
MMVEVPEYFRGPTHTVTEELLREILNTVKPDTTPGLPLSALKATKGELIKSHHDLIVKVALRRLNMLNSLDFNPDLTEMEMFTLGLLDVSRVFVKNEPHPIAKLISQRFRLIVSVSIVDELICRLIFGKRITTYAMSTHMLVSQPGAGYDTDEQAHVFWQRLKPLVSKLKESDVSAFDFSLQPWMFEETHKLDLLLTSYPTGCSRDTSCYGRISTNYVTTSTKTLLSTSDGRVYTLEHPGIQLTGKYWTAWKNSQIRELLIYCVGGTWGQTYGDDSVEDSPGDLIAKYLEIGIRVTDVRNCSDTNTVNFCSMEFGDGIHRRTNVAKPLFNLIHKPNLMVADIKAFMEDFRHNPEIPELIWALQVMLSE